MTIRKDEALTVSNPRLISAIYFGLLSMIFTLVISTIVDALGLQRILPLFHAMILAGFVAALFGALFGERIIHSPSPYHRATFWWAFLMMLLAVPVYCLGFVAFFNIHHAPMFVNATFFDQLRFYVFILGYSYIIFGLWLAIFGGFCALYLRGYLVYYIMNSKRKRTS